MSICAERFTVTVEHGLNVPSTGSAKGAKFTLRPKMTQQPQPVGRVRLTIIPLREKARCIRRSLVWYSLRFGK